MDRPAPARVRAGDRGPWQARTPLTQTQAQEGGTVDEDASEEVDRAQEASGGSDGGGGGLKMTTFSTLTPCFA